MVFQHLPLDFPPSPRESAPLTGPSTVPSTQALPRQDPCGAEPHLEGSFSFIHGASLTDGHHWSPCSASAPTRSHPAPHPSSHISCALISPLDFICYTLPPTPSINSTKASIFISLLPAAAPLGTQRKHTWEEIALIPVGKTVRLLFFKSGSSLYRKYLFSYWCWDRWMGCGDDQSVSFKEI